MGDRGGKFTRAEHDYPEHWRILQMRFLVSGSFLSSTVFFSSFVAVSLMMQSSFHPLTQLLIDIRQCQVREITVYTLFCYASCIMLLG